MFWNKTVLAKSETYTINELIKMQKEAGEERDAYVELIIKPTTPIYSPVKSPTSPTSPKHRRAFSSPIGIKMPSSPPRFRASLSPSKSATFPEFNITTLSLSIRETAAKDRNHTLTAADFQRFVERCQAEALVELREIADKVAGLRRVYQGDVSMFVSLLDIMMGVVEGVRKAIANPGIRNINKNTVACIRALNGALGPYQNMSARQLEKTREGAATLMQEMLCGAVRALESVETFLGMENGQCEGFILNLRRTR
ncbi:hypothetical protein BDN70DRAFT_695218 [Pholiota conissans]|uniref:Uncharacterized protein n=1 Tax=Pholiota conissans TaxID=109636 RepID=A0A9P6D163_9AGAR|nr:hypothetical protein BDN70DRAFT_695218 [Pholiota conissans]